MRFSSREPIQHFGANGVNRSSIEIAVDQRPHIGKARQIDAEFVFTFKRMAPFVLGKAEQFVGRVNSHTEAND
jgi:hypothetical protein